MKITNMTWKPPKLLYRNVVFFCCGFLVFWLRNSETANRFRLFWMGFPTSSEKRFSRMKTGGPSLLVFQVLGGGFNKFLFSPLIGEDSHFDESD